MHTGQQVLSYCVVFSDRKTNAEAFMSVQSINRKRVVKLKNRIRGAIKRNANTADFMNPGVLSSRQSQSQRLISAALAEARKILPQQSANEFEAWVEIQLRSQKADNRFGPSLQGLGTSLRSVGVMDLGGTLSLAIKTLDRHRSEVAEIISAARSVGDLIERACYLEASHLLIQVNQRYGLSYWSLETEIALASFTGGAEAAKERFRDFSKQSKNLSRFYFYCAALRADPSQPPSRYKQATRKKINAAGLSPHQKIVSLYRACGDLPQSENELAVLLTVENLSSKIDLIFTAIAVALKVVTEEIGGAQAQRASRQILQLYGSSLYPNVIEIDQEFIFRISESIQQAIGVAINHCLQKDAPTLPAHTTESWLASSLSTTGSSLGDDEALHRFSLLLPWHEWAIQWGREPKVPKLPEIFWECSFGSSLKKSNLLVTAIEEQLRGHLKKSSLGVPLEIKSVGTLDDLYVDLTPSAKDCVDVFVANLFIELDLPSEAIRRCVLAILQSPRLAPHMPLDKLFSGRPWRSVAQYGESVALCTALHQYYTLGQDHHAKSFKRFAVIALMKRLGVDSLDALLEHLFTETHTPPLLIDYFARHVCDLPLIELLPKVSNTKQAREVQSKLLRVAARHLPDFSVELLEEASAIDARNEVDSAMEVLDDTRVYVAEDQLAALATRDFSLEFERYKQIAEVAPTADALVASLLQELRQATYFPTPITESEDLLFELVSDLVDLFMNDEANGLDSVIGRRIRHGDISGELRGTLDGLNLIGHKPKSGAEYDWPSMAKSNLSHCSPRVQRGAKAAFAKFSKAIDSIVATLRDEAFQCRTKDGARLRAAFEFSMSNVILAFAKTLAKACDDVGTFAKNCFSVFWVMLNAKVERERNSIADFLKQNLRDACQKLLNDIRSLAPEALDLLAAIQAASEELQRRAAVIISWIRIPELSESRQSFPLSLVIDMAVSVIRARRPGFDPIIVLKLSQDLPLNLAGLFAVEDAVQIAIDNIAQHSGIKTNTIKLRIEADEPGNKLNFSFVSEISKGVHTKERIDQVSRILEDIKARRASERARGTSGSGLSRLAALVQQDSQCDISFGFEESLHFRLEFSLSMERLVEGEQEHGNVDIRWSELLATNC